MYKESTETCRGRRARQNAKKFAALGDDTRLQKLMMLGKGEPRLISELTAKLTLTRQAVTKQLHVIEAAKFIEQSVCGSERRFVARRARIKDAQDALQTIAQQWNNAFSRLKSFVKQEKPQTSSTNQGICLDF